MSISHKYAALEYATKTEFHGNPERLVENAKLIEEYLSLDDAKEAGIIPRYTPSGLGF